MMDVQSVRREYEVSPSGGGSMSWPGKGSAGSPQPPAQPPPALGMRLSKTEGEQTPWAHAGIRNDPSSPLSWQVGSYTVELSGRLSMLREKGRAQCHISLHGHRTTPNDFHVLGHRK